VDSITKETDLLGNVTIELYLHEINRRREHAETLSKLVKDLATTTDKAKILDDRLEQIANKEKQNRETMVLDTGKAFSNAENEIFKFVTSQKSEYESFVRSIQDQFSKESLAIQQTFNYRHNELKDKLLHSCTERKNNRDILIKRRQTTEMNAVTTSTSHTSQLQDLYSQSATALQSMDNDNRTLTTRAAEASANALKGAAGLHAQIASIWASHALEALASQVTAAAERRRYETTAGQSVLESRMKGETTALASYITSLAHAQVTGLSTAQTEALSMRHNATINAAIADAEVSEMKALASADAERKKAEELARKTAAQAAEAAEEKAAKIRATFEEESATQAAVLAGEKRRQQANLEAKLRERKAAKLRKLAAAQSVDLVTSAVNAVDSVLASIPTGDTASATNTINTVANQLQEAALTFISSTSSDNNSKSNVVSVDEKESQARLAAIQAEEERTKRELQQRQAEEKRKLEQQAAEEATKEAALRFAEQEAQRKAAIEAKKKEMEARLSVMASSNAEEAARLRAEFDKEMEEYTTTLDAEKARQAARLNAQLEARKARKARELARKQETERAEEEAKLAAARTEAEAAAAALRERSAIQAVLSSNVISNTSDKSSSTSGETNGVVPVAAISDAIEGVLQQRHTKETADLLARQYSDRARELRTALETLFDKKREEVADTLEKLRETVPAGSEPSQTIIDAAVTEINNRYEKARADTETSVREELDVRFAREQLALRQRQLNEIAAAMAHLAPNDILRKHEAEEAAKEAAALEAFQSKLVKDREERIEKLRLEKERAEAEARRENEEALARLEAEHAAALAEESARADAALAARKAKLAAEAERAREARLQETSELDKATRDRVMAEFDAERKAIENKLDDVRAAQMAKMEAKLAERREKARRKKEKELEETLRAQAEAALETSAKEAAAAKEAKERAEQEAAARSAAMKAALTITSPTASSNTNVSSGTTANAFASVVEATAVKATEATANRAIFRSTSKMRIPTDTNTSTTNNAMTLVIPIQPATSTSIESISAQEAGGPLNDSAIRGSRGTALLARRLDAIEEIAQKLAASVMEVTKYVPTTASESKENTTMQSITKPVRTPAKSLAASSSAPSKVILSSTLTNLISSLTAPVETTSLPVLVPFAALSAAEKTNIASVQQIWNAILGSCDLNIEGNNYLILNRKLSAPPLVSIVSSLPYSPNCGTGMALQQCAFAKLLSYDKINKVLFIHRNLFMKSDAGDIAAAILHLCTHIHLSKDHIHVNDNDNLFEPEYRTCMAIFGQSLFRAAASANDNTSGSPNDNYTGTDFVIPGTDKGSTSTTPSPLDVMVDNMNNKLIHGRATRSILHSAVAKISAARAFSSNNLAALARAAEHNSNESYPSPVSPSKAPPSLITSQFIAGSVADTLSHLRAFNPGRRETLQSYLTTLESNIMDFKDTDDDNKESDEPVSPDNVASPSELISKNTPTATGTSTTHKPRRDSILGGTGLHTDTTTTSSSVPVPTLHPSDEGWDRYVKNTKETLQKVTDALDKGEKLFLERTKARDEALLRVAELETVLDTKKTQLRKVQKAEKHRRSLLGIGDENTPIAEEDDENNDDDDDDDDDDSENDEHILATLPPLEQLKADIHATQQSLDRAKQALQSAEDLVTSTANRISKLSEAMSKYTAEANRIDQYKNKPNTTGI